MASGGLFNLARGAKAIALLLFLVPWVTVSCGGTEVSMTGYELATGATGGSTGGAPASGGRDADVWVIAAAALILGGLALSFVLPRARAALLAALAAIGAATLIAVTVLVRLPDQLGDRPTPGEAMNAQQADELIRVQPEIGFWLVMAALIAAAALNLMARNRAGP